MFFTLKASSLKGIAVQAITNVGENTVLQAHGQSEILCALSGAKIMLTVRKKGLEISIKTLCQATPTLLAYGRGKDSSQLTVGAITFSRLTLWQQCQDKPKAFFFCLQKQKKSVADHVLIVDSDTGTLIATNWACESTAVNGGKVHALHSVCPADTADG